MCYDIRTKARELGLPIEMFQAMAHNKRNVERVEAGNWRPFRPMGMTDRAWETMLKVHRYPNAGMSAEERRHCLGSILFGKGGPRFSSYGRGWIQSAADKLLKESGVKSPHFLDTRDFPAIKEAIDYYNGGDYAWACKNGLVREAMEEMERVGGAASVWIEGRFDKAAEYNWYRFSYGAFGGAIDDAAEQWVGSGFSGGPLYLELMDGDVRDAFENVECYDGQGIDCCHRVRELNEATNLCPIYPNKSLLAGIDCALGWAIETDNDYDEKKKIGRFIKRAIGELQKRRDAVGKVADVKIDLDKFDRWMRKRSENIAKLFPKPPSIFDNINAFTPCAKPDSGVSFCFGDVEEYAKQAKAEQEDLLRRFMESMKKRNADRNAKQGE